MSGVPYHAWTHRPKAQGGTDPIPITPGETVDYAFISWNAGGAVTVNTLTNPANIGGFDYYEGFSVDFGVFDGGINLNSGSIISDGSDGWYLAEAWAIFNGGATAGSQLGIALDCGPGGFSTYRVGNSIIANSINEVFRIPVSRTWQRINGIGDTAVRILVWHDDAGGQDLNSAFLSVTYLSSNVTGTFLP